MNYKEFRYGNLVCKNGQNINVTIDILKEILVDGLNGKEYSYVYITDDILLKAGFEKRGSEYILEIESEESEDSSFIIAYFEHTKAYHYTGGEGCRFGKGCKYVHELQNLYFALTGEELILK